MLWTTNSEMGTPSGRGPKFGEGRQRAKEIRPVSRSNLASVPESVWRSAKTSVSGKVIPDVSEDYTL